jgi:hypothetical protein
VLALSLLIIPKASQIQNEAERRKGSLVVSWTGTARRGHGETR